MLPIVDCAVDSNPVGDMQWRQEYKNGTVRNVTDIVQGTLYNFYMLLVGYGNICTSSGAE